MAGSMRKSSPKRSSRKASPKRSTRKASPKRSTSPRRSVKVSPRRSTRKLPTFHKLKKGSAEAKKIMAMVRSHKKSGRTTKRKTTRKGKM